LPQDRLLDNQSCRHCSILRLLSLALEKYGKKVTWTGVNFWRTVDGKIVSKDSILNLLDALKQLGAIEYTEKAKAL
jgi:hypothetical protein